MTLQEKREKRAKLVTDARALVTRAQDAKRAMTADEQRQFDEMMKDTRSLKTEIDNEELLASEERSINASAGRKTDPNRPDDQGEQRDDKPIEVEFRRNMKVICEP